MDLYSEHLNSLLIPDSERKYYLNIIESFRRVTHQIEKTKGVWTKNRLEKIQEILKQELLEMNKIFSKDIQSELDRIISADIEYFALDKEVALIASGAIVPELFSIDKVKLNRLIKDEPFLFSYIKADGTVVKSSVSMKQLFRSVPESTFKKVNGIFLAGATVGDSPEQIARDMKPFFVDQQKHNVRNVTRTLIGQAVAKSHRQWEDENSDVISHYEYVATLDMKTSSICRTLDGKTWKDRPEVHYQPKLHINCRSLLVSVPPGYSKGTRPLNLMTAKDRKHLKTLKGKERHEFFKSKIKIVDGNYTYKDAVNDYPQLANKKFINLSEYEKKLGVT